MTDKISNNIMILNINFKKKEALKKYPRSGYADSFRVFSVLALLNLGRYDEAEKIEHIYETTSTGTELPLEFDTTTNMHLYSTPGGDVTLFYPDAVPGEAYTDTYSCTDAIDDSPMVWAR